MERIETREQFLYLLAGLELQELLKLRMQAILMLMRDHNGHPYSQAALPRFEAIQDGSLGIQLQGIREHSYESHGLTEREREVVSLVVEGLSNADIASRLFVTEATVKKHLRTVYKKIKVKNRFQLVKEVLG